MPHGLGLAQFSVLNHFVRLGEARTAAELTAAFQVTKGAMTNTVQRLEAQDFVSLTADNAASASVSRPTAFKPTLTRLQRRYRSCSACALISMNIVEPKREPTAS